MWLFQQITYFTFFVHTKTPISRYLHICQSWEHIEQWNRIGSSQRPPEYMSYKGSIIISR